MKKKRKALGGVSAIMGAIFSNSKSRLALKEAFSMPILYAKNKHTQRTFSGVSRAKRAAKKRRNIAKSK